MFSDLRLRLRALFDRGAMERELDDELRFHVERETEKLVRLGISHADAERKARVAFGGMDRIKEDARDARGVMLIDTLRQDLRYAWRGVRSKPGFSLAVIVTLGLGIGANTAMFGMVDRLLFRAPAFMRDAENVHRVYLSTVGRDGKTQWRRNFQYTRYADITKWTTSFDRAGAFAYRQAVVGTGPDAREMPVAQVSWTFFTFFDARPALGRYFLEDEDRPPSGVPVAVLTHSYWMSQFGGRRDVIGRRLSIGSLTYTVIGVAAKGFVGFDDDLVPIAFIPITAAAASTGSLTYHQNYNRSWLEILVHRKPEVSIERATADLTQALRRSWEVQRAQTPQIPAVGTARPQGLPGPLQFARGPQAGTDSRVARWVSGVALIVLLVACANVTNLMLARAVKRRREIAMRVALGVSRARLVQQLATESVLLAALGGTAGLVVAHWGGRLLSTMFLRRAESLPLFGDARTLCFIGIAILGVALLTGIAPVFHSMRDDVLTALKYGARDGTHDRTRTRSMLQLLQGVLCVVLLIGAGLFVRSLQHVRAERLGYDVPQLVFIEADMRDVKLKPGELEALSTRLVGRSKTIPGVADATLTISVPFWSNEGRALFVSGVDSVNNLGRFMLTGGSPSYFTTTGTRILRGRAFTDQDRENTPAVVVVSENMARVLWPADDAIGKCVRIGSDTNPCTTVVGIAETMRGRMITGDQEFWYYLPVSQYGAQLGSVYPWLLARVSGRPADMVETIRRELQTLMPGSSLVKVIPLQNLVGQTQRAWEFGATMFVAFGLLALVLAAIGLYSVIAYAVAQRTHELGVRIALGASGTDVVRMIVRQGVSFAVAGVVIGSVIALWAGRWVEPLLFAQSAKDVRVFGAVALVVLLVAVVATLRPAIRATRVDPMEALRVD